jgi:hypothetical protein
MRFLSFSSFFSLAGSDDMSITISVPFYSHFSNLNYESFSRLNHRRVDTRVSGTFLCELRRVVDVEEVRLSAFVKSSNQGFLAATIRRPRGCGSGIDLRMLAVSEEYKIRTPIVPQIIGHSNV